jgi:hypothetical protein
MTVRTRTAYGLEYHLKKKLLGLARHSYWLVISC